MHLKQNGVVTVAGQAFWRLDDLNKQREGVEFIQKPSILLLQEDWPREELDLLLDFINHADE